MPVRMSAAGALGSGAHASPALLVSRVHVEPTLRSFEAKCSRANARVSSIRCSVVSTRSAASASTISRKTRATLRFSAASAAFHSTALSVKWAACGQQHLVVPGGVATAAVEPLAGLLGRDRLAGIVGRRAHGVDAGNAGQVPGTGEQDGRGA